MKKKKEQPIDETLDLMKELMTSYEKSLATAKSLLELKQCIIELQDEQKKILERQVNVFRTSFIVAIVISIASLIASFYA